MIWKVLGIEPTKDEEVIRDAYHTKLHDVNPEDDAEGFKELRRAYEQAMEYANTPDDVAEEEDEAYQGKKTEVDLWIGRVEKVYEDAGKRISETEWNTILHDPICNDLDTELEAAEKLLVFFMSHSFMPQNIWQLVDQRFHYMENYDQLKEKFPENYLDYVKWQIENPHFIDFSMFDGKTDKHVDDYINKLYEMKSVFEQGDLDGVEQLLKELERFDLTHPYTDVEKSRYYLARAKELKQEGGDYLSKALSIMEDLDFQYSENDYIERVYADVLVANNEVEKAKKIYDALVEKNPKNHTALLGQANCIFLLGDPEEAKERIEDVLEERVQDVDCLELLDEINEHLVETYTKQLEEEENVEVIYKLGWCYYQQKKFQEGIALLDQVEDTDSYDYVNLRCRLYLANEEYKLAYPLAKRWISMILETVDDGSRDAKKKKNRESLANFSLGVCVWEIEFKNASDDETKREAFLRGIDYLEKAITGEQNLLVRLSYMEQLARFYMEAEEYEKCVDICTQIIEEDRGFFPAYVHRQKANYELKNAKEVIDDFFMCKDIYPAYVPPYLLAAEVFYAFEQYDDVENVIEAAKEAELESDTLELYRIRCIHYKEFSEENTKKALSLMKELRDRVYTKQKNKEVSDEEEEVTDIEDLAELEREYAILYWDMEDIQMTMGVINSYLEKNPDNSIMLHLKVDVLNREDEEEEALKICQRLIELEPDNLYTRAKLGKCYELVRKLQEAIETYESILKVNPDYVQAVRRLMYIHSFMSNRERDLHKCQIGIDYATRLIELTGTAEGYVERGNLYIDLYELEKSVEDCRKAIELDSEAFYAYNNLGCALLKLRRVDEAIEPLEQIIKMEPEHDALPYLNLAECYVLQNRIEEAIDLYNKVMEIWPKRVGLKEEVANLYCKLNAYDKAIALFNEIPDDFVRVFGGRKNDATYIENRIEAYNDMMRIYARCKLYKNAEKCVKKAMLLLIKYKGNSFPNKTENIIEFYRDRGDYKMAEKYGKKLLDIAKKRGYNDKQIIFAYTTVLFELGKEEMAKKYAKYYLKNLFENEGPEEQLFADRRYINMYAYNLAIMNICLGNKEKACELLGKIPDCKLCVMCETSDCFEYYFGMGLIAELNNRLQEAKCFYEKAIEIKGRYACAENHLEKVNQQLKA